MYTQVIHRACSAIVAVALIAPFAAHAVTIDPQTCVASPSVGGNARFEAEAAKGKVAARRFLARTEGIYPLDRRAEMAKLDAAAEAKNFCEARNAAATPQIAVANEQAVGAGR